MTLDQGAPSDRELIAQIADGDRGALHTLFTRHQPWLAARVRRRCSDPAIVAEVVNDTFLTVWQQPRKYRARARSQPGCGASPSVRSCTASARGSRWSSASCRPGPQHHPSAEEAVLLQVQHSDVGQALQKLSPELLAVVQATVIDGLSTREAAALLGIPSGTVKSRMSRARLELREALL